MPFLHGALFVLTLLFAVFCVPNGSARAQGGPDSIFDPACMCYREPHEAIPRTRYFGGYTKQPKASLDPSIHAKVDYYALRHGVPAHIAHAVIRMESGYKPHVRGRAGEWGLGQILCATARGIGFSGPCQQLRDPNVNLDWSMRYLRLALDRGSVGFYNAGIHARTLPHAARQYADRVMGR